MTFAQIAINMVLLVMYIFQISLSTLLLIVFVLFFSSRVNKHYHRKKYAQCMNLNEETTYQ